MLPMVWNRCPFPFNQSMTGITDPLLNEWILLTYNGVRQCTGGFDDSAANCYTNIFSYAAKIKVI